MGNCFFPVAIKPNYKQESTTNPHSLLVGCGKCLECRRKRARDWIFRLQIEQKEALSSYFITLTYDDQHVPFTPSELPTLNKKDFQNFMKRLRKDNPLKLTYYATGEYGGRTQRPHYHAIIFNLTDIDLINKNWQKGHVQVDPVNGGSIAYVTGYVNKYLIKKNKHPDDDRLDEFNLISRGIGKTLLLRTDVQHYVNQAKTDKWQIQGDFYTLPRYIKDKIAISDDIKLLISERKAAYFTPFNELSRQEQRTAYDERIRLIRKANIEQFKKLKI